MEELFLRIAGSSAAMQGLVGGAVIAFLNMVGALAILLVRNPSQRLLDAALGGAAGVMIAASFTSLIIPGIERGGIISVLIGIVAGTAFLDRADAWVPHMHVLVTGRQRLEGHELDESQARVAREDSAEDCSDEMEVSNAEKTNPSTRVGSSRIEGLILFMLAITLHNMPEGLAVGVGFGSGDLGNALSLMLAIGLQNIPEGLAVSIAARNAGMSNLFYAALTGIRAGLVELPIAVFGAAVVSIAAPLVPYAMGFAAGAMLYVVADEIIPETHAEGNERAATLGLMGGLVIMLTLDVVLG